MKVLVSNPEVSRGVTESLPVAVPGPVEELVDIDVILLYEYPTVTAGRPWDWTCTSGIDIEVASCKCKRIEHFNFTYVTYT